MMTWWEHSFRDSKELYFYRMARRFGGTDIRSVDREKHSRVARKWIRKYWNYRYKNHFKIDWDIEINGIPYHNEKFRDKFGGFLAISEQLEINPFYCKGNEVLSDMLITFKRIGKIGKYHIFSEIWTHNPSPESIKNVKAII
jgi:hypothetical protein